MKKLCLTLLIGLSSLELMAEDFRSLLGQEDLPVKEVLNEKPTPLWAQEFSGADLVKAEISKLEEEGASILGAEKIPLAIYDLGFEKDHIFLEKDLIVPPQMNGNRTMRANHGTSVFNLLRPFPHQNFIGITDEADVMDIRGIRAGIGYAYAFTKYERENNYPKVISNSLGWPVDSVAQVAKTASDKGIFWFLAAGNAFPKPIVPHELNSDALLVGSYAPSGLTSYESQIHAKQIILAPSNEELLTTNGYGDLHHFGATSGATPIVAGMTINLLKVLPHMNFTQLRILLKKSGHKSLENKLGMEEMPRLLNGLKAFKVAERIARACHSSDIDSFENCTNRMLTNDETFQFERETVVTCDEALKSLSPLVSINSMREQALLGNNLQAVELACVYERLGFKKNAEFFQFITQQDREELLSLIKEKIILAFKEKTFQVAYYRYLPFFTQDQEVREALSESELSETRKRELRSLRKCDLRGSC